MTLDARVQVDLPDVGITVSRSRKYSPIYKILRSYRNDKGKPISERVIIGKLNRDNGKLIPNQNYYQYYKVQESRETLTIQEGLSETHEVQDAIAISSSTNYNVSIGAAFLLRHIIDSLGLPELLDKCFDMKRSRLIQTAALYMVARNNVFENVTDFCEGYTLSEAMLTSQGASELFASISPEERITFFRSGRRSSHLVLTSPMM